MFANVLPMVEAEEHFGRVVFTSFPPAPIRGTKHHWPRIIRPLDVLVSRCGNGHSVKVVSVSAVSADQLRSLSCRDRSYLSVPSTEKVNVVLVLEMSSEYLVAAAANLRLVRLLQFASSCPVDHVEEVICAELQESAMLDSPSVDGYKTVQIANGSDDLVALLYVGNGSAHKSWIGHVHGSDKGSERPDTKLSRP